MTRVQELELAQVLEPAQVLERDLAQVQIGIPAHRVQELPVAEQVLLVQVPHQELVHRQVLQQERVHPQGQVLLRDRAQVVVPEAVHQEVVPVEPAAQVAAVQATGNNR